MTTSQETSSSRGASFHRDRGMVHFFVAVAVLFVAAAGWELAVRGLKLALAKMPMPWPKGVIVDEEDFYLKSLPSRLGHYVLVGDGEMSGKRDGHPDGIILLREENRGTLGVGGKLDEDHVHQRRSNWYCMRVYRDERTVGNKVRLWRLDVTYYTGGVDPVPHIPEVCVKAGGATLLSSEKVNFYVPVAPRPWDEPVQFVRTQYETWDDEKQATVRYVQYYVFNLNGRPENSREKVRGILANPFGYKHSFFAKIQFAPWGAVGDPKETDRKAEDFVRNFLPSVLQQLPTREDVERMDATEK